jgi:hypothetical protein
MRQEMLQFQCKLNIVARVTFLFYIQEHTDSYLSLEINHSD